jgi:hypothetical protein
MKMYEENTNEMAACLAADLRKHKQEAIIMEIDFLKNDLKNVLANFRSWVKPEKVGANKKNGPVT